MSAFIAGEAMPCSPLSASSGNSIQASGVNAYNAKIRLPQATPSKAVKRGQPARAAHGFAAHGCGLCGI